MPRNLLKSLLAGVSPWPLFVPVVGVIAFFLADYVEPRSLALQKPQLEVAGIVLIGAAVVVAGFRVRIEDNPLMLIMLAWTADFFLREVHFDWTSTGVYLLALAIAAWAFVWRERLAAPFHVGLYKSWFYATGFAYFVALVIQRRALKHLPFASEDFLYFERRIHIGLEEWTEVVAHACLLTLCFCGYSALYLRRSHRREK